MNLPLKLKSLRIPRGMQWLMFSLFLFCGCSNVLAQSLYLDLVQLAQPDTETIQKATEQIEQHSDIQIRDQLSVAPFHKRASLDKTENQPLCLACHLPLPHKQQVRSRAFLNMHSRYIACETCHFLSESTKLDYLWRAYDGEEKDTDAASVHSKETGSIDESQHSIIPFKGAKIAPFFEQKPIAPFLDSSEAQKIKEQWSSALITDKARLKAALHTPLKKEGAACDECHADDGQGNFLDLRLLGASKEQIRAIQKNTIAQFFRRYKNKDGKIQLTEILGDGGAE